MSDSIWNTWTLNCVWSRVFQNTPGPRLSCWLGRWTRFRESKEHETVTNVSRPQEAEHNLHDVSGLLMGWFIKLRLQYVDVVKLDLICAAMSCPVVINPPLWTWATSSWPPPRKPWWTNWPRTRTTSGQEIASARAGPMASNRYTCCGLRGRLCVQLN